MDSLHNPPEFGVNWWVMVNKWRLDVSVVLNQALSEKLKMSKTGSETFFNPGYMTLTVAFLLKQR